jgi:hypothetical protein
MYNIKTQKNVKRVKSVFDCDLCDYNSKNKTDYNRHLLTKKHIDISNEREIDVKRFDCECGKSYKLRQGLYKHKQNCEHMNKETVATDKEIIIQLLKEKEEMKKQIEIEKLRNTKIDNNNNNLNIQINAFGCEDLEHITDAFKIKCLKQIYKSIPEMVIKIHFNTQLPENRNVRIPNKKLPHASIMTRENTWKTVDKKDAITSMVDKSFNLLEDTYEEHKGELSEMKRQNYEKYQEKYLDNDKQLHKQLENDVECLVLDGTR